MKISIRKIEPHDNVAIARIIRTVMPSFGADQLGFALYDMAVDDMYSEYAKPRTAYFVCEVNGRIVGGAGIAPLQEGEEDVCELQKMYFLPEGRGRGYGQQMLTVCLQAARENGFSACYLETFHTMHEAMALYEKNDFKKIPGPLGNTGHFACDTFYMRAL